MSYPPLQLKCELSDVVHIQIASLTTTSMFRLAIKLQYHSVIPAYGIVLRPGVFSYGRLVHEAFDACILMLLQTCFELMCIIIVSLMYLSTGAWHFVDDVR